MILKKSKIAIFATLCITASAVATTIEQRPKMKELEGNPEYMALVADSDNLTIKEDSIRDLLADTRAAMRIYSDTSSTRISFDEIDRYSSRIIDLEQELFIISTKHGEIMKRINAIELAYIEKQFANDNNWHKQESEEQTPPVEEQSTEVIKYRNIIDNDCIKGTLSTTDFEHLRAAHSSEAEIEALGCSYIEAYNAFNTLYAEYMEADNQIVADSLYALFDQRMADMHNIDNTLRQRWNNIADTKYYSYDFVLEHKGEMELLDDATKRRNEVLVQCNNNNGFYASDNLMAYVLERTSLLDYEIAFAEKMELHEAQDSLQMVRSQLVLPDYKLDIISKPEERLFLDYTPISFGSTSYYNTTNPIPELTIYERGTIYRILLGKFKSRQPVTLFKGVQPLYIAKDDEQMNCYYTGGFATYAEAEEAYYELKNKGFKAPIIYYWEDGVECCLGKEESSTNENVAPATGVRYMLHIATETLSEELRITIEGVAPAKRITRIGERFAVGTFDSRSEAEELYSLLNDLFELEMEIAEIEIQ